MAEGSPYSPDEDKLSQLSRSDPPSEIARSSQLRSELDRIRNNLIERIEKAKDSGELRELVQIWDDLNGQELKEIQIKHARDRLQLDPRRETIKEVRTTIASTIIFGAGLFLTIGSSAPLLGSFLIILGAAKPLEISISEMSGLLESFANSVTKLWNLENRRDKKLPPNDRDED